MQVLIINCSPVRTGATAEITKLVPDQPSGLPVGVSGEAGFLRTITDFVLRKS